MDKFLKLATFVLIIALISFSCTANAIAQGLTETQQRESEIQQRDHFLTPDDLHLNSEFLEYLQWPLGWNQRSGVTLSRQDSDPSHDQYPQYLLPTQFEQLQRTVRTEEGLRLQQSETQEQSLREGIVLQTEQRQLTREAIVEPRQPQGELATNSVDSGTEHLQQEQTEHFVAPLKNSSIVDGGTIV